MSRTGRRSGLAVGLVVLAALVLWLARTAQDERATSTVAAPSADAHAQLPVFAEDAAPPRSSATPVVASTAEPATAAVASATRLIVHVTWAADGSPAADVGLKLFAFSQPSPLHHVVRGRSDEQGTWVVDPAPLGDLVVYSDRGGSADTKLQAGETKELSLALAAGTLVTGLVVDPEERPVSGADIWMSDYGNHENGAIVTQCGADGRFTIRGVEPWHFLSARAAGHVPSPLATVDDQAPAELELRLQVGGAGAAIHGTVVSPEGTPVAAAWVLAGPPGGWPGPDPHRGGEGPPPLELRTAADGSFLAADMPPGTTPVAVKADGWSPWSSWTKVAAGETAEMRVELRPSASISGTVRSEDGAVLAGVRLMAGSEYGASDWVETLSDAAGHYLLRDLPLDGGAVRASQDGLGEARHSLIVEAGKEYAWDPVLSTGARIVGSVLDQSGEPVEGLNVQADSDAPNGRSRQARVAPDGRFTLDNCDQPPYLVQVFAQDWKLPVLVAVGGVRPGPDELRLVIPVGAHELATVTGRLVDARGRPPGEADVSLMSRQNPSGMAAHADPATGEFKIDGLGPGAYALSVSVKNGLSADFPFADLRPGEQRDVGRLVLPEAATVLVSLHPPPGLDGKQVMCFLRRADGSWGDLVPGEAEGLLERRSKPTAPGDYVVNVSGDHVVTAHVPVTLVAGQEARVDVTLETGVKQLLGFTVPNAEARGVEVWISDDAGVVVANQSLDATASADGNQSRAVCVFVLRPGSYALRVALDGKESLQSGFDVPAGKDKVPAQEFKLP